MIIDSEDDVMGVGQDLPDAFNKRLNCIDLRLNRPNTPDCLIGYANRDIMAGENLYAELGKRHWKQKYRFKDLSPDKKKECLAYYSMTEKDIKD